VRSCVWRLVGECGGFVVLVPREVEVALVCTPAITSSRFPTFGGIGRRARRAVKAAQARGLAGDRVRLDQHLRIATTSANTPSQLLHVSRRYNLDHLRIRSAFRHPAPGTLACSHQPTSISVSKLSPSPSPTHVLAPSWTLASLDPPCSGVSVAMPTSPQSTPSSSSQMSRTKSCSTRAT
jgi:hypothetical protein